MTLIVPAPAKLNLFLHVTGRETSGARKGYHHLESLMVLVDLADTLHLTLRDDGRIVREQAVDGVSEVDDLCLRAARVLQQHSGCGQGVSIRLDKRIPIGAGLGGGSSDAASVLLGLNRLWKLGFTRETLMRIGVELGADVPFFIFGRNAHATGIGERLREVTVARSDVLIAAPDRGVSTASIFGAPELERSTPATNTEAFPAGCGGNDLQPVAMAREPTIAVALEALGPPARMTGSGSAVFRIVDPAAAALHPPETRDPRGFRVFRCRLLASHPLREFA